MRLPARALGVVATLAVLPACVPPTYYAWGGYDDALYAHYKSPQDRGPFVEQLKTIILASQQAGRKVPPGILAEYGFALLEEGQIDEAVGYFQREREAWPESRPFMDKMIRSAERRRGSTAPGQGPAGALEGKSRS